MKKQLVMRMPEEMSAFLTAIAERKGVSKNSLMVEIFWEWKRKLNRNELIKMFGEKELIEMEIAVYGAKKRLEEVK